MTKHNSLVDSEPPFPPGTLVRLKNKPKYPRPIIRSEWHRRRGDYVYIVETTAKPEFHPYWFAQDFVVEKYPDEEQGFLSAVRAAPEDTTTRLVYADWLQEREDPRADFVRLQVHLREIDATDPELESLIQKEQRLRAEFDSYWRSILDPPVWCVGGTFFNAIKVYIANPPSWEVLNRKHWRSGSVQVIVQPRKSPQWITTEISVSLIRNWQAQLIRNPSILLRLRKAGWSGFQLRADQFTPQTGETAQQTIRRLLKAIQESTQS